MPNPVCQEKDGFVWITTTWSVMVKSGSWNTEQTAKPVPIGVHFSAFYWSENRVAGAFHATFDCRFGLTNRFQDTFSHFQQKTLVGKQKYTIWNFPKYVAWNITVSHSNPFCNSWTGGWEFTWATDEQFKVSNLPVVSLYSLQVEVSGTHLLTSQGWIAGTGDATEIDESALFVYPPVE